MTTESALRGAVAELVSARASQRGRGAPDALDSRGVKPPFSGRCACGAIRYTVGSAPLAMVNCHCRDCQYASGGAHSSSLVVHCSAVTVDGEPRWYETRAASGMLARRGFCPTCGSPLFADSETSRGIILAIKAASLDAPEGFEPMIDMWMRSAVPWACTNPAIPKFDTNPPMRPPPR